MIVLENCTEEKWYIKKVEVAASKIDKGQFAVNIRYIKK